MTTTRRRSPDSQGGFVLVTSLIFLVIITLIAVSAMNSSTLQERMASNLRDMSHARQDADATLRQAETLVQQDLADSYKPPGACYSKLGLPVTDCSQTSGALKLWIENKMFTSSVVDDSAAFLDPKNWTDNGSIQSYAAEADSKPVLFFVEELPKQVQCSDLNPSRDATGEGCGAMYRITARAQGQNPAAIAVTQSMYEMRY